MFKNTTPATQLKLLRTNRQGFSLVELIVTLGILSVISLSIWSLFNYSLKITAQNKARTAAMTLAEQKIELVRNLPYDDVGTTTGIPPGVLLSQENIIRNDSNYTVSTDVIYIDDPFDGTINSWPADNLPYDYKTARIVISWLNPWGNTSEIVLITNVSPQGMETATNGGTLLIVVSSASGVPIEGASISLINTQVGVQEDYLSDSQGQLLLPGAPPSEESYQVVVTKSGYSQSQTYDRDLNNPEPTPPHLTVIDGEKTEASFKIDLVSTLTIKTVSQDIPSNWQINTDSGTDVQKDPDVAIDNNGYLYFVWEDDRISGSTRIYAQKYDENGTAQWPEDIQISTANNQVDPRLAMDSQNYFYIVWGVESAGNQEIYLEKYSSDGVDQWTGPKKISTDANSQDQFLPDITIDSADNIYVAWVDNRNTNYDIYAQKFSTDGSKLWTNDLKITTATNCTNDNSLSMINDSNNNLYITWQDDALGDNDIYAQKISTDGSKLWSQDLKINTNSAFTDQSRPQMAIDSLDNLYFTWQDYRSGTDYDVYVGKYDTNGARVMTDNWAAGDIQINNFSTYNQISPSIGIFQEWVDHNDIIYISWTSDQSNEDIYAQKLDTAGNKLWSEDEKMNTDISSGVQDYSQIVVTSAGNFYVTWEDTRLGNEDIYAGTYAGPGIIVPRGNVPLTIKGSKTMGANPVILKYEKSDSTNTAGTLTLPETGDPTTQIEWDDYIVNLDAGGGYTLLSIDPAQPITVEPGSTTTVTLIVE